MRNYQSEHQSKTEAEQKKGVSSKMRQIQNAERRQNLDESFERMA